MEKWKAKKGIWNGTQILFMGDDLPDLPLLQKAGLAALALQMR